MLGPHEVAAFERCIREGGVAIFPADTVYGLACAPDSAGAIARMYALKGRAPTTPSAVMFFRLDDAFEALGDVGRATSDALARLLPGPVTAVLPNPAKLFPLASAGGTLGIRVPALAGELAPLAAVRVPVLQTSANPTGGPDARSLDDVASEIRAGVDVALDAGPRSGTPSTVIDLSGYERGGSWRVLREGALGDAKVRDLLRPA